MVEPVRLALPNGRSLEIAESGREVDGDPPPCEACRERGEQALVQVLAPMVTLLQVGLCAECIAAALAVKLGAEHVRAGGSMDDLKPREPR